MRQKVAGLLCKISSVVLIICLLFTCIEFKVFDLDFFQTEYIKSDTARNIGMNNTDLMSVTKYLLEYIKGKKDNLRIKSTIQEQERDVFNKKEREHMVDVQNLYINGRTLRNIAVLGSIVLILLAVILARRKFPVIMAKSYIAAQIFCAVILLALGAWILFDFDSFWTSFHMLFFTNDLWLLNPATDIMINMFSSVFFYDLCISVVVLFASICVALMVICKIYLKFDDKRRNQPMKRVK